MGYLNLKVNYSTEYIYFPFAITLLLQKFNSFFKAGNVTLNHWKILSLHFLKLSYFKISLFPLSLSHHQEA